MALRYSFGRTDLADGIERAISRVLNEGLRTGDIAAAGQKSIGTAGMGDAVIAALGKELA